MISEKRILVGVPGDYVEPDCVKSIFKAVKKYPNAELEIMGSGYGVARNRNMLANKAIADGFSHLLFVDADMVLPENTIDSLFECMEQTKTAVASGWACCRPNNDMISVAHFSAEKEEYILYRLGEWHNINGDYVKIDGGGLACALVDVSLFSKMRYPYFKYVEYENRTTLSEDLFFFDTLRRMGIETCCAKNLKVTHIKKTWV